MTQISNKRLAKNTLLLYFRMVMVMGMGLYTSRVTLNALGVEDFGVYNIVAGIVIAFSFLINTLSGATSRFITYELGTGNFSKLKNIFNSAVMAHIILALIIFILAETIGLWFVLNKLVIPSERLHAAIIVYQFSIFSSLITLLHIPYRSAVIAHERMSVFAYISIIEVLLKLFVVIMLTTIETDKLILYGILVFLVTLVIIIIYCMYSLKNFEECKFQRKFDKTEIKPILVYSIWNLYGNLSDSVRVQGVSILLNLFFTSLINAATGIAIQVQNALILFSESFLTAVKPQIVKSYAANQIDEMQRLVINSSKYSYILLLLISLPLIVENNFVLSLWLYNVPEYAVVFCQLSIIYSLISVVFSPLLFSIQAAGKIKVPSFISGTIFITIIPISYFFLKNGSSPIIPYILSIILMLICWGINLLIIKNYIPSFSNKAFINKSILVCIYITIFSSLIPVSCYYFLTDGWIRFLIVCLSSSISIILITYLFILDIETKKNINNKLQKLIFNKNSPFL